ncbi:hypothetical protein ACO0R3_002418 [Hanseniaspora guilliermondii]
MSSTNVSVIPNNTPSVSNNMFEYLYSNDIENISKHDTGVKKVEIPFMTEKDVQKTIKVKELQGLNPIILIIYDIVYDLTNYNDHPGGKKILRKYNGTDCTQIFIDIGHNVDSLKYDINWQQCVIGRVMKSIGDSRNNSSMSNKNMSNLSIVSSINENSHTFRSNTSEQMVYFNESMMVHREIVVKQSDHKFIMKNLVKMGIWLLLLLFSYFYLED